MTQEVLSHHKLKVGWAELSTGRGIHGGVIYGVTVRKSGGERLDPDPSKLFYLRLAALAYIKGLQT